MSNPKSFFMSDDINTSTVTIRKRDGRTITQTTVKGESGTKTYNTENGRTYLVNETTRSGSRLRYSSPDIAPLNNNSLSMESTGGGVASSNPPTSVNKVPVYAKLNPDGTISTDIYTKEDDKFTKSETTFINEKGETVVQTAQIPDRIKQRIEAGSPTAITDEATGKPIQKVGGATVQTGKVRNTNDKDFTRAPPSDYESIVTVDAPFFTWRGQGQRFTRAGTGILTAVNFFSSNRNVANIANPNIRAPVEFVANNPYVAAGIVAGGITAAPYVATAAKGTSLYASLSGGYTALTSSTAGLATVGTLKTAALGLGTTYLAKETIPIFDTDLQRRLMNTAVSDTEISKARAAGRQAEVEALKGQLWYKNIANELNPLLASDKKAYTQGFNEYLTEQGYSPAEILNARNIGLKGREYDAYAEAAGILAANAGSELLGRRLIAQGGIKLGASTFGKNFAKIGLRTGLAGVGEGITIRGIQTVTRKETTSAGELALYGGAGFVSAGALGGLIGATAVKPKVTGKTPRLSNFLLGTAYITDPFEYAGDKLATVGAKASNKILNTRIFTPIVTITPSSTNTNTFTSTGGRSKGKAPALNLGVSLNTNINTNTVVPTRADTPTNARTTSNILGFTNVNTRANVNIFTNILSNTNTPTNVNTPASVNVPANVPVSIVTPVTVAVPNARLPPVLPLALPRGSGTGRGRSRTRRKYINELQVGSALLKDLTGSTRSFVNTNAVLKPRQTSKRRKSNRGRRK